MQGLFSCLQVTFLLKNFGNFLQVSKLFLIFASLYLKIVKT